MSRDKNVLLLSERRRRERWRTRRERWRTRSERWRENTNRRGEDQCIQFGRQAGRQEGRQEEEEWVLKVECKV